MCLICIDFKLGRLTANEAMRNAREFVDTGSVPPEHMAEIEQLVRTGGKTPAGPATEKPQTPATDARDQD